MNEQDIRLLELYFSGDTNNPELRAALKEKPYLIEELARDRVAERLIKHHLSAASATDFTAQVTERLKKNNQGSLRWLWPVLAAASLAAVVIVSLADSQLANTQPVAQVEPERTPVIKNDSLELPEPRQNTVKPAENIAENPVNSQSDSAESDIKIARFEFAYNENLLSEDNAYFENGDLANWSLTDDSVGFAEVRNSAAKSGRFGVYVNTLAGKADLLLSALKLPESFLRGQTPLRLSFDVKNVSVLDNVFGGFARLSHLSKNSYKRSVQGRWFNGNTQDWQKFERLIWVDDFPANDNRLEINFRNAGQEWYLDNIELIHVAGYQNLLHSESVGFESGEESPYLVAKSYPGSENQAFYEVNKAAAISGQYGLYVDSYSGDMKLKLLHWAFDFSQQLPDVSTYWLTFDARIVQGQAAFEITPRGGTAQKIPSWPLSGFEIHQSQVDENGLVKVTAQIPADLVKAKNFDLSILLKKGAIVHLDNFSFLPIQEE